MVCSYSPARNKILWEFVDPFFTVFTFIFKTRFHIKILKRPKAQRGQLQLSEVIPMLLHPQIITQAWLQFKITYNAIMNLELKRKQNKHHYTLWKVLSVAHFIFFMVHLDTWGKISCEFSQQRKTKEHLPSHHFFTNNTTFKDQAFLCYKPKYSRPTGHNSQLQLSEVILKSC